MMLKTYLSLCLAFIFFIAHYRSISTPIDWNTWAVRTGISNDLSFLDEYRSVVIPEIRSRKTVHMIQHTHTDVGWLLTMKQYEDKSVEKSINSIIEDLPRDMKLSWTNYDFLRSHVQKYPDHLPRIKQMVSEGRLEVLNGGVVMPDQACTYYDDLIDVYDHGRAWGLKYLGKTSRIGWAIDSFGESAFHARMLADMGYEISGGVRIPQKLKEKLRSENRLIHYMKGKYPEHDMLHFVIGAHYNTRGIDLDRWYNRGFRGIICLDFEVLKRAYLVYTEIATIVESFKEDNVLLFAGDDFRYVNATWDTAANQAILIAMKSNARDVFNILTMVQSTVEEAFNAIASEKKEYSGIEVADFYPYDRIDALVGIIEIWNGFYTTNSHLKKTIRTFSSTNRGVMHLLARRALAGDSDIWKLIQESSDAIEEIRFTQGIMMHHDAITGTCMMHVARDYLSMMAQADALRSAVLVPKLVKQVDDSKSESRSEQVIRKVVCNQDRSGYQRATSQHPGSCDQYSGDLKRQVKKDVCVVDNWIELAAFECKVAPSAENKDKPKAKVAKVQMNQQVVCASGKVNVSWDGVVLDMQVETKNGTRKIGVGVYSYMEVGSSLLTKTVGISGLYVMALFNSDPNPIAMKDVTVTEMPSGLVALSGTVPYYKAHVTLVYDPREEHATFRVHTFMPHLKDRLEDQDVVLRFISRDIINDDLSFATDSNGFNLIDRRFNNRRMVEYSYYPVSRMIQLRSPDSGERMTVMTDRSQAGTSRVPGVAELSINRMNIANEELITYTQEWRETYDIDLEHKVVFDAPDTLRYRECQVRDDSAAFAFDTSSFPHTSKYDHIDEYSTLRSLLDFAEDGIKLRLFNMHDTENVTIPDIKEFVKQRYGVEKAFQIEERSLDYNQPIETILNQPYLWRNVTALKKAHAEEVQGNRIILKPLTMKTYRIRIPDIMGFN